MILADERIASGAGSWNFDYVPGRGLQRGGWGEKGRVHAGSGGRQAMARQRGIPARNGQTRTGQRRSASSESVLIRPSLYLPVLVFVLALALLMVSRQAAIVRVGYQIDQLKNQVTVAKAERDSLQLEVTRLQSLDRIEKVATSRLGMVRPQEARAFTPKTAPPQDVAVRSNGLWERITSYLAGKLAGLRKVEAREIR